ncbi:MAG: DUF58 domain-containing protein [Pyrinomonadaceae bacterium]
MNFNSLKQLFSLRDLRNAALGTAVVVGGLVLSGITLIAHLSGNVHVALVAAAASLVFAVLILFFVVPPLARNAGREASQLNLPFEFTSGGAVMMGLILIVGFSAWTTGNNLLFLVLSFLIAATAVGFIAGALSLKKLDVAMRFPDTIFAGESTAILVSINNRKRLIPAYSTVVEVRGKEREHSIAHAELTAALPKWAARRLSRAPLVRRTLNHFIHVAPRQKIEARAEHVFPNRGRLLIKDFELSTKFPFGFFRHRRRLAAREAELTVFPRLVDVDPSAEAVSFDLGKYAALKRGSGQDLLALRDYQPQDDLRRIDWKATARTRQLTVREFAAEHEKRITLVLFTKVPAEEKKLSLREKLTAEQAGQPFVASERFEQGVSMAASMLAYFVEQGAEIRLVIDTDAGEYGSGRPHLHESLRRLSVVEPTFISGTIPLEPLTSIERILDDGEDDHSFLITAIVAGDISAETTQRLNIIGF